MLFYIVCANYIVHVVDTHHMTICGDVCAQYYNHYSVHN